MKKKHIIYTIKIRLFERYLKFTKGEFIHHKIFIELVPTKFWSYITFCIYKQYKKINITVLI